MALDLQPTLRGRRLALTPLGEGDRDALYAAACDPLIWEQHPYGDRWRREEFDRFFDDALASGGALAITDSESGAVIGTSRYARYDSDASEVEIGWTFLTRAHWGDGSNAELKALMLGHAFATVKTVVFRVGEDNLRSRRAVERLGATMTGVAPDPAGIPHVAYRLTREAWTHSPQRSASTT